jgi:predicted DNA-binding transcriptional regulator YafY
MRTYALDRIVKVDTKKKKFNHSKDVDIVGYFKNSFGIIAPNSYKPEKVVFNATVEQANYIRTFPLHASQKILKTSTVQVTFELTVFITYDLIMELLSYGDEIKVESPKSLIKELTNMYSNSLAKYKS